MSIKIECEFFVTQNGFEGKSTGCIFFCKAEKAGKIIPNLVFCKCIGSFVTN